MLPCRQASSYQRDFAPAIPFAKKVLPVDLHAAYFLLLVNSVSVQTVLEKKVTDHPFQTHHQPIGHSVILA